MDLDQRRVKKSDRDQEVIPLQALLAVAEELFIDRLCVIDIGLKLSRLAQAGLFPCLLASGLLHNGRTAGARTRCTGASITQSTDRLPPLSPRSFRAHL